MPAPSTASRRRGRHRAPSRFEAVRLPHVGRAVLPGVLLGTMGSSLVVAGLLPTTGQGTAVAHAGPAAGTTALAAASGTAADAGPAAPVDVERPPARASRDRVRPPAAPSAPAAPLTPPPPPAPVDPLPECDGDGTEAAAYGNGRLPDHALCSIGIEHHRLRADAAHALALLDLAHRADFGTPLCVISSYRSLDMQYAVRRTKGRFAARPGSSTHGLGQAVDIGCGAQQFGSPLHRWLEENGPRFGWHQPEWAQRGGTLPEPWHWEHLPA